MPDSSPSQQRPTLAPELLSGRSLRPDQKPSRREAIRSHRALLAGLTILLGLLAAAGIGKLLAERSADSATAEQAAHVSTLLDGATPEDFLAFNAGVQQDGSIAQEARDAPGFVNVKAAADRAFIRFQPEGWWSGFTERCIVATVDDGGVTVTVPKTACIRVAEPGG